MGDETLTRKRPSLIAHPSSLISHPSSAACRIAAIASLCVVFLTGAATPEAAPSAAPDAIVAKVGDEAIRAGDVERLLKTVTQGKPVNPEALPLIQAQVLDEILSRRIVLAYARRTGAAPNDKEIDAALARLKASLSAAGQTLEERLKAQSLTEADLRRQAAWGLVWERYLAKYLTDQRVEAYWKANRRAYDGAEMAVSHILLRSETAGPKATDELVKQAERIREQITSGRLTFADAAKKHSAGPSAKDGGRLGWIGRRGPMDEAFSRAAFALAPGQVSPPVRTRFGVHLIRCDEIKPGDRSLAEVRKEVEEALARELLEKLAALEARHTPVQFTGAMPYFKPGTRELVK